MSDRGSDPLADALARARHHAQVFLAGHGLLQRRRLARPAHSEVNARATEADVRLRVSAVGRVLAGLRQV